MGDMLRSPGVPPPPLSPATAATAGFVTSTKQPPAKMEAFQRKSCKIYRFSRNVNHAIFAKWKGQKGDSGPQTVSPPGSSAALAKWAPLH